MKKIKFKDVPVGGRISYCWKIWVVMKNYDEGLVIEYTGEARRWHSLCSFVDAESGVTLDTEVNFIG